MHKFALTIALSLCASVASAGVTSIQVVQTAVAGTPAGFVVNDILIDFDSQLFGQQMVVELSGGSIYNHATFGTDTAPNPALFGVDAAIASDSFVTIGGADSDLSENVLVVGGSTELGMNGPLQLDDLGINIAWAPAPGVVVPSGSGYITARVTLSDDANGAAFYFGNAGDPVSFQGWVSNGVMTFVPEPSTALMAVLGLVGLVARRRS